MLRQQTFLSKRFDRNKTKRIHFASAMNLLNKAFPNQDNYKIIRELLNLNLIKITDEINLMDTNQ